MFSLRSTEICSLGIFRISITISGVFNFSVCFNRPEAKSDFVCLNVALLYFRSLIFLLNLKNLLCEISNLSSKVSFYFVFFCLSPYIKIFSDIFWNRKKILFRQTCVPFDLSIVSIDQFIQLNLCCYLIIAGYNKL